MDPRGLPPIDLATGLPLDPMTGLPLDPALMAGAVPPPMVGPDGLPVDPMLMAGMQPPMPDPSLGMQPPMLPPEPEPPPVPPVVDPLEGFAAVILTGTDEEVTQLLDGMDQMALAMLRDIIEKEIKPIDPDRAKYLLGFMPEKRTEGQLPSWMKTAPPKPTAARVHEIAQDDADAWSEVVNNDLDTMQYLTPPYKSHVFRTFDQKKDERYHSPMLLNEVNLIVNKGSASEFMYQIPYTDPGLADATQQCEDFLYDCDRQANRLWAAGGRGDFERDMWYSLETKGRVMTLVQPCMEATDHFLTHMHMDPSTTFPTWAGDRGLERVVRIYEDTAANVIGDYDAYGDLGVEKKIIGKVIKEGKRLYEAKTRGKVTCYWDRWWYVVLYDDIEVLNIEHKYGLVPFAVTGTNMGLPSFMGEIRKDAELMGANLHDNLLKAKYPSRIDHMKEFAGLREKIGTAFLTKLSKMNNPARNIYQDPIAMSQGTPVISDDAGAINPMKKDQEELVPMPEDAAPPAVFAPFYQMFGQDASTTFMPGESHGVSGGPNQSGNQMENLSEVGNDKMVGSYQAMAAHKAEINRIRLSLWRDFGHAWKNGKGEYGKLAIPYPKARRAVMPKDTPPAYDFFPEVVELVGTVSEVDYTTIRTQNLTQVGNGVMIWKQAGAMSSREAMELRGVRDPEAVEAQILYETLMMDPDLMKLRGLAELEVRDPDLAEEYKKMIGGGGAGGSNSAGSPVSTAPNSSAMNLTALGMGPQGPTGRPGNGGVGTPPM